ncbi:DUF692 domain-containing protein [Streptomyces sp. NPDC059740]|uniref:DUF692 domain-containing protein n=1 Tax=Streptomyces sp. NPDC059740 TaxID=3346926 RepID=UPI00365AE3D5
MTETDTVGPARTVAGGKGRGGGSAGPRLGAGIGWRPEIAEEVARLDVDWVEVVAENLCPGHLPPALEELAKRGKTVIPHGVSLGLGGADRPDPARLAALADRVRALGAPLVTEHIAFVRAGGPLTASPVMEAGHLLPVPRTRDALEVLCENVRIAQAALPVPLALENIAALFAWPGEEMSEGRFLTELVERTGVGLLIDVANLHTNHVNRGEDPARALAELPLEALAYVHVAGGVERDGVWHDSHAHPVPPQVLEILGRLCARTDPPGVLLERDEDFPEPGVLAGELAAIREVAARGHLPGPAAVAGGGSWEELRSDAPARTATTASGAGRPLVAAPDGPRDGGGARQRLALAQTALLASLVAGAPVPEGFDGWRLGVQGRALVAKRAGVVARVAPELPHLLGEAFRPLFAQYAAGRPMRGGYRLDALDFAAHLLARDLPAEPAARRRLARWRRVRAAPKPPVGHRVVTRLRRGRG